MRSGAWFVLASILTLSARASGQTPTAPPAASSGEPTPTPSTNAPAANGTATAPAEGGTASASPANNGVSSSPAPAASSSPAPAQPQPTIALIDTFPNGVDPAAATFVTGVLRDALTRLGYAQVPTPQLYEVARRIALPYPPPPDGVLYLMRVLNVPIAITCDLRGGGGYYQAILRVRFAQEPTERIRQVLATQWTLGDSLRAALPSMLAPPTALPYGAYGMPGAPALPDMTGYTPPPPRPSTRLHINPIDVALGAEFAFGPGSDAFFNFLGYARLAWFPVDRFGITASVSYANLRGRTDRVSNVLFMAGVETAVDLLPRQHIYLPLRAEAGYLPFNGPVARATAGVGIGITRDVRLELDLLSPTVWGVSGGAAVSLDLGVQLVIGFGAHPPPPPTPPQPPPRHHRHRHRAPSSSEAPSAAPETESSGPPTTSTAP